MATETSSIDDVLATAHLPPETPIASEPADESPERHETGSIDLDESPIAPDTEDAPEEAPEPADVDDYGNEQPKQESRTYTEEEVNERINKAVRERLARLEKNQGAPTQQQQQQAQQAGFEYDPNAAGDWQAQLKQFIRQTNEEIVREQQQREAATREQQAQAEFEEKFHAGMSKFADFRDVVGQQPITDAMTIATRAMKDPAAFLYAASKRHSDELQRISRINDPYTQMVEMGRLEERMRKGKMTTQAPRPLNVPREDATIREPESREPTIEDLMRAADERKLKKMNLRRR